MAVWACIIVVLAGLSLTAPAATMNPAEEKLWEDAALMGNMYGNQEAGKSAEITSRCKETPKAYVYTLQVPGIRKEDMKVEVEEGVIRIKGEEKKYEKHKDDDVYWSYGQFWKQFPLPDDADVNDIKTNVANGVLIITVSKL